MKLKATSGCCEEVAESERETCHFEVVVEYTSAR